MATHIRKNGGWIVFEPENHQSMYTTEPCKHLGKELQHQRTAGCTRQSQTAMVYECSVYGRATKKRKVLIPNSRRPDMKVGICLGCTKWEPKNGDTVS